MNIDISKLYLYAIVISLFFFVLGSITNIIEVAVIGLLISVGLLVNIVLFALKDFGWFEKPDIVYVDRPVGTPQDTPEVVYNEPEPQEEYEDDMYPIPVPVYCVEPEPDLDFHLGTLVTGNKKKKNKMV